MTIKERYKRARRNYLRRINTAVRSGYRPEVIPIPKHITEGSIRRLEKWRGEYIRTHSVMVDVNTGDELKPTKNKKARRQREKAHREYMNKPLQEVDNIVNQGSAQAYEPDAILPPTESYEQIIDNWYDNVHENFYWYVTQFIIWQTNKLIYGKDAETRKRFAYVYAQNPDIFPEPPYESRENIIKSFNEIARMMELAPDSEAYQDFLSLYDTVEFEGE